MADGKQRAGKAVADLEGLAKRFQDLWQEQLAATASDPEFMEMMGKWMGTIAAAGLYPPPAPSAGTARPPDPAAWIAAIQQALAASGAAGKGRADDASAGRGSPQAGAKTAAPASGAGDVVGDQFERRLAALEQRVERLEAGLGGPREGAAARTRRRKS